MAIFNHFRVQGENSMKDWVVRDYNLLIYGEPCEREDRKRKLGTLAQGP